MVEPYLKDVVSGNVNKDGSLGQFLLDNGEQDLDNVEYETLAEVAEDDSANPSLVHAEEPREGVDLGGGQARGAWRGS